MKKLLFNGCSFVAGDALVWDKYCLEKKFQVIKWEDFLENIKSKYQPELQEFSDYYRFEYRRLHNLPMATAIHFGYERIDISEDGNSNDNISLATIAFFSNKTIEERRQYHVCIGWTSIFRFSKFIKQNDNFNGGVFANANPFHTMKEHREIQFNDIQNYIDITFKTLTDEDVWVNYVKNIMLLENFLISNGITYTFFRSLGDATDTRIIGPFPPFDFTISKDKITNDANWLDFGGPNAPYANNSWTSSIFRDEKSMISKDNRHPNLHAVANFSSKLAEFIKNQGVL